MVGFAGLAEQVTVFVGPFDSQYEQLKGQIVDVRSLLCLITVAARNPKTGDARRSTLSITPRSGTYRTLNSSWPAVLSPSALCSWRTTCSSLALRTTCSTWRRAPSSLRRCTRWSVRRRVGRTWTPSRSPLSLAKKSQNACGNAGMNVAVGVRFSPIPHLVMVNMESYRILWVVSNRCVTCGTNDP